MADSKFIPQLYDPDLNEVPYPPPCICGNRKYSFVYEHDRIRAKCTKQTCRYSRFWYYKDGRWSDVNVGKRIYQDQKWVEMDNLDMDEFYSTQSYREPNDQPLKTINLAKTECVNCGLENNLCTYRRHIYIEGFCFYKEKMTEKRQ